MKVYLVYTLTNKSQEGVLEFIYDNEQMALECADKHLQTGDYTKTWVEEWVIVQ